MEPNDTPTDTSTEDAKVAAKATADEVKAKAKVEREAAAAVKKAKRETEAAEKKAQREAAKLASDEKKAAEKAQKEAAKAAAGPVVKKLKSFNMAPQTELKKFREGTKRAKVIELMTRDGGATFSELMLATGWDDKTAYEGVRLVNLYVGYGLKTSEDGHITAWFPTVVTTNGPIAGDIQEQAAA